MARNKRRNNSTPKGKRYSDNQNIKRKSCDRRDESSNEGRRFKDDGRNDISWYSRNPNLLVAAGSFPYPYRPGMSINLGSQFPGMTGVNIPESDVQFKIPGVMVMDWVPSLGQSHSPTDPASVLGKEIYARVRKAYSGELAVDAPDFVIYLMALDSLFAYIAWLKRLYRVLNAWTPNNYVLPDVLISAMGLTMSQIKDLRANQTKLWQYINELILQSRKFTCPAIMDLFNRHYWMSDNVYTDEASINSQFYMFNLKAMYMYQSDAATGASSLGMSLLPQFSGSLSDAQTAETFYNYGLEAVNKLVAWDDAYTINGYLSRAYEGVPSFVVDELPQFQEFAPLYTPEVLVQIENSRCAPFMAHYDGFPIGSWGITQDVATNSVLCGPSYTINADEYRKLATMLPMLSIRSDNPQVADSVIASRLQVAINVGPLSSNQATVTIDCGTEVPLAWRVVTEVTPDNSYNVTGGGIVIDCQTINLTGTRNTTASGGVVDYTMDKSIATLINYLNVEQFDWHPFILFATTIATSKAGGAADRPVLEILSVLGDTHNITTITNVDLENLHKVCIYSELNAFAM